MKKILIIEDDKMVVGIYRERFAGEGFQVEVAYDGEEGLRKVGRFRPDVVILDLMLPKLTGAELVKQIRSRRNTRQLPVIVFSSTYLSSMVQEAWKAGATQCLSKSNCTPRQVLDVVRSALGLNGKTETPPLPAGFGEENRSAEPKTTAVIAVPPADADAQFQAQLRQAFVETLPAVRDALRGCLRTIFKSENETIRHKHIQDLRHRIHTVTCNAGIIGLSRIAQIADALEALLKELIEKPKTINGSTLRTLTSGVDFLVSLFNHTSEPETDLSECKVLVVDDEAISRRAITYALDKAKLKSVSVEDPLQALDMVTRQKFELIFLDVDMPNMNGFELCGRVRTLPDYKQTPVVFVTSLNDFENRVSSSMSGGNDFIAKPFLFIELAVKALVYVVRSQLQSVPV